MRPKQLTHQSLELLSTREACSTYGVSERTIRNWRRELFDEHAKKPRDLILADLHLPYAVPGWLPFLKHIKTKYSLNRLIMLGDLTDQHAAGRWGQLPEAHGALTEFDKAKEGIASLAELFPNCLMCPGNHDDRVYRMAKRSGVPSNMVKTLHESYGLPDTWILRKNFHYETVYGPCLALHGHDYSGPGAADKWYNKLHSSVIMGHVHTAPGIRWYMTPAGMRYSIIAPCMADEGSVAMEYAAAFGGCFVNGVMVSVPGMLLTEIFDVSFANSEGIL